MKLANELLVGIDEAGRGPLAGPVSVGVALVPSDFDWEKIPGVNDSKKLTEAKREEIFKVAQKLKASGQLDFQVSLVSAKQIDKIGIVPAIKLAMIRGLKALEKRQGTLEKAGFKLDGGLKAPERFINQETIIKGDGKEKVIGLASIVAKVNRDRYMVKKNEEVEFVLYNFATHKGYGTKMHREAIARNGLSTEHRKSYCKNIHIL